MLCTPSSDHIGQDYLCYMDACLILGCPKLYTASQMLSHRYWRAVQDHFPRPVGCALAHAVQDVGVLCLDVLLPWNQPNVHQSSQDHYCRSRRSVSVSTVIFQMQDFVFTFMGFLTDNFSEQQPWPRADWLLEEHFVSFCKHNESEICTFIQAINEGH